MITKQKTHFGFTLIELMVVIAIIGFLSAVILVSLNKARDKGENAEMIQQVREYINAIQLSYVPNGNMFPNYGSSGGGKQLGCLVVTNGSNQCHFNTTSATVVAYPSTPRNVIGNYIKLAPINPPIVSSTGRIFDSIKYGSEPNGSYFVLEYPMKNTTNCGVQDASQFGSLVGNITICRYVSR